MSWKEIFEFAHSLPDHIQNDQIVFTYLKKVKVRCGACQEHWDTYPRPQHFETKFEVLQWIENLRKDIIKKRLK